MKHLHSLFLLALFISMTPSTAQTADEIVNNYLENTGGAENWKNVSTLKFIGKIDFGGMVLPIELYRTSSGLNMTKADVQGQIFYQEVYDGETLWGTNQMTMAAEKSDAETTSNFKNNINDFPDPFIDYKEKGYRDARIVMDTVIVDKSNIDLNITLNEGNRYYFGDINFLGNSVYSDEFLARALGLFKGDVYNGVLLKKRIADNTKPDGEDLTNLYQNNAQKDPLPAWQYSPEVHLRWPFRLHP